MIINEESSNQKKERNGHAAGECREGGGGPLHETPLRVSVINCYRDNRDSKSHKNNYFVLLLLTGLVRLFHIDSPTLESC